MITSMQNKTVKELLKLKQKKYRKDYYLVETNHLVEEAIKAKQTDLIISTEPVDLGVENLVVSKEIMEKLAFTKTPQPIMARCFIQKDKKIFDFRLSTRSWKYWNTYSYSTCFWHRSSDFI